LLTKDNMGAVEPACHNGGDEELGSVGVLASIGHGQHTGLAVLDFEVLIL
jgi:hypothetical protein